MFKTNGYFGGKVKSIAFKTETLPTGSLYVKLGISICIAVLIALQLANKLEFSPETVALVVIAVLPWLSSIVRSVELPGGGKVTFREKEQPVSVQNAFTQLYRQVADLQDQLDKLDDLRGAMDPTAAEARPEQPTETPITASGKLILWVDDKPRNNAFEIAKLKAEDYTVVESTSTDDAMQRIQEGLIPDVIITDMGRKEGKGYVPDAGLQLITKAREAAIQVPVFCYTSPKAAQRHHDQTLAAGGEGATASPIALFQMIKKANMRTGDPVAGTAGMDAGAE